MSTSYGLSTCFLALTTASFVAGCQNEPAPPGPASAPSAPPVSVSESPKLAEPTKVGESAKRVSGLVYETLKDGAGPQARSGDTVTIHCTASAENGKPFFATRKGNHPVTFKLGDSRLLQGWNEGIAGMKVGEQRKLTIPPNLAYGALGRLPVIPPNGTLTLDIEVLALGEPPANLNARSLGVKFTLPSTEDLYAGKNEWIDTPAKEKGKE